MSRRAAPRRPALRSRRAGCYATPDGRYSLRRGTGRFHDAWTLHDHATGLAMVHDGKRAALAALSTLLTQDAAGELCGSPAPPHP